MGDTWATHGPRVTPLTEPSRWGGCPSRQGVRSGVRESESPESGEKEFSNLRLLPAACCSVICPRSGELPLHPDRRPPPDSGVLRLRHLSEEGRGRQEDPDGYYRRPSPVARPARYHRRYLSERRRQRGGRWREDPEGPRSRVRVRSASDFPPGPRARELPWTPESGARRCRGLKSPGGATGGGRGEGGGPGRGGGGMLDAKTVSVLKLFRDCLRLADYLGHKV